MSKREELFYREHFLDSSNRVTGDNNIPVFILDNTITGVKRMRYVKSEVPKTYYATNEYSRYFVFEEELGGGEFSCAMPIGTHNLFPAVGDDPSTATYSTALQALLNSSSPNGYNYVVLFNSVQNTFTIYTTTDTYNETVFYQNGVGTLPLVNGANFRCLFNNAPSNAHLLLGFQPINTAYANTHTGTIQQRITTFPEFVFIRGTIGETGYGAQIIDNTTNSNVLTRISTAGTPRNKYVEDYSFENDSDYFKVNKSLDRIEMYCTYNDLNTGAPRIIDFNGIPWALTIGYFTSTE